MKWRFKGLGYFCLQFTTILFQNIWIPIIENSHLFFLYLATTHFWNHKSNSCENEKYDFQPLLKTKYPGILLYTLPHLIKVYTSYPIFLEQGEQKMWHETIWFQSNWIPTLKIFLEDSHTNNCLEKYIETVHFWSQENNNMEHLNSKLCLFPSFKLYITIRPAGLSSCRNNCWVGVVIYM